jgi:hypothetical protein
MGESQMKWWKLVLGVTVVGVAALLLTGRGDIIRFRRMHKM